MDDLTRTGYLQTR